MFLRNPSQLAGYFQEVSGFVGPDGDYLQLSSPRRTISLRLALIGPTDQLTPTVTLQDRQAVGPGEVYDGWIDGGKLDAHHVSFSLCFSAGRCRVTSDL